MSQKCLEPSIYIDSHINKRWSNYIPKVDPSCSFVSISGSDVTIIGAGSCQVKVSQAAFGAYRSAEVFININIEKQI